MVIHFATFNAYGWRHINLFSKSCQRIPSQCNCSGSSWLTRNIDDTICLIQTQYWYL